MDEIRLSISCPNEKSYKKILLRKFFYMIFIDANGRKLYAYIASVFGGITKEDIDDPKNAYNSVQYLQDIPCTLNFEFRSPSDNDIIEKITPHDCTNGFFRQTEYISKVWGKCKILSTQTEVSNALKTFYPALYPEGKEPTFDITNNTIMQLCEEKKGPSHKCIVTKGQYGLLKNEPNLLQYSLSYPSSNLGSSIDGLEIMNWIKIDIDLKTNILHKPVLFSINLDKDKFFTPDFTWYFAPPTGHIVSPDSSVKIGGNTEKNAIQSVADDTTVFFSEWTDPPESIAERKKSRVLVKSFDIDEIAKLSSHEEITVSLHLENPQGPTNRQFFFGLLVAFLLSFCSDKTRINDYYSCLKEVCKCAPNPCNCRMVCNAVTIIAPFLLLLSFLTFVLLPKKALPSAGSKRIKNLHNVLKFCRLIALWITVILVLYVYVLWLIIPGIMAAHINCLLNQKILLYGAVVSVITNSIYILYCVIFLKRELYNFL